MATTSYEERKAKRAGQKRPVAGWLFSRKVRGTLRVAAYVSAVSLVAAGFAGRSAWGSMSEQALATGRQLSKLEQFRGAPERLSLNGQSLNISSTVSDLSLEQVLDRFEGVCKEDGSLARDFKQIDHVLGDESLAASSKKFGLGIIRQSGKDDGVIACTVKDPSKPNRSTMEGFRAFAKTWDLDEIGLLRYAYARRTDSGKTHVLTVWSDGSFKVNAMFPPKDGRDAPGSDPDGVPRPPDAVRYLTAAAEGRPHSVRIYDSRASASEILAMYEKQLPTGGWERVDIGSDAPTGRYFSRNGVDLLVVAEQSGDHALVSMLQTRGF